MGTRLWLLRSVMAEAAVNVEAQFNVFLLIE
jgi:hypothetical protein